MPRNGSGIFTLVSGSPVVTGTTIESNWANTTLSDIATTLTDSLSRSGQGGMTAALRVADGTQGAPGVGFANETGSGFYRAGTGEVWAVVQGAQTLNLDANGVYVPADKTTTVDGAFVFNEAGADKDARFEGDTDANLLFVDASTDRVGVGTNTPTAKLNVEGSVIINDAGADVDVRIEGDTDANLLFVDASTDRVGVGTATPSVKLDVAGAAAVSGNLAVDTNTLYVDASANVVGIGTTSVLTGEKLDVSGGVKGQSFNAVGTPAAFASAGGASLAYNGAGQAVLRAYSNGSGAAGELVLSASGGLTDAVLTSTGLGIGTSSVTNPLTIVSATATTLLTSSTTTNQAYHKVANAGGNMYFGINNSANSFFAAAAYAGIVWHDGAYPIVFGTNNTERARITSGGYLLVGRTSGGMDNTSGVTLWQSSIGFQSEGNAVQIYLNRTTSDGTIQEFRRNNTTVGTISVTTTATAYNTSSDYRLKDNPQPLTNSGAFIDALQPKTWEWKVDGSRGVGFIAHEAQAVSPSSVVGQKDAVDADGKPVMQAMEYGSAEFIANIIAELQSLRARVAALEANP